MRSRGFSRFIEAEKMIVQDRRLFFTFSSYVAILITYANLSIIHSSVLGFVVSIPYFVVNGTFLGDAFLGKETVFFRLTCGVLLLIMLLTFVGWLFIITYNLDTIRFVATLFTAATISSLVNRWVKNRHAN